MSNPMTIVNLFQQTLIGQTETIKNSEKQLLALHQDPNFIPNLLLIPKESSIPYNIQKAAILYTKIYAKYSFLTKNLPRINFLIESIINFMADPQVSLPIRTYAASTLNYILLTDREGSMRKGFFTSIIPTLLKAIETQNTNIDPVFIGLNIQVMLSSSQSITYQLMAFIRSGFVNFCSLNSVFMQQINKIFSEGNLESIISSLKILKLYSHSFKLFCRRFPTLDQETVKLLFQEKISEIIDISLEFELKGNQINTSLIYVKSEVSKEIKNLLYEVKADYVAGLKYILRTLTTKIQQVQLLKTSKILQKPMLIPFLVSSLEQLLKVVPYKKIKSQSLITLIQEIYDTLLVCIRSNAYYSIIQECKNSLINGCIFKTLLLNNEDYENHYYAPSQFIDSLFQVVDKDATNFLNQRKNENTFQEKHEEIQNYDNLRTVTATILGQICKKQDGCLSEIFIYTLKTLQGEIKSQFPKSLLLIVLGVLRDQVAVRKDLQGKVIQIVFLLIGQCKVPSQNDDPSEMTDQQNENNILLSISLIILMKYLTSENYLSPELFQNLYNLISKILMSQQLLETLKLLALELIEVVCCFCEKGMASKLLQLCNSFLQTNPEDIIHNRLLQTYDQLFKMNNEEFSLNQTLTIQTIHLFSANILQQVNKGTSSKRSINKYWNVLTCIFEDDLFVPKFIPEMEKAVIPLVQFADGDVFDFQENILMMLTSFIKKSHCITQNQLIMFDIIPKLYYSSYNKQFGHAFETLQIFIYYGGQILAGNPQAIKGIIQMAVVSMKNLQQKGMKRSESDNCEGVLLLQSLIIGCGKVFDSQMWIVIANEVNQRLQNPFPETNFLKANLYATNALILMIGSQHFSPQNKQILLNKILQNIEFFNVNYAPKIIIIVFSQLITLFHEPYITVKLTYMVTCLINLIQNQRAPFESSKKSAASQDYETILSMMKNEITERSVIEYFRLKIAKLKEMNPQVFEQIFNELSENNKSSLKQIVSIAFIQNENRKIIKVQR